MGPEHRAVGPVEQSRFTWGVQMERFNEKLFIHADDVPGVMQLFASADTHWVAPDQLEACLRGMEAALVEAAHDSALAAAHGQ